MSRKGKEPKITWSYILGVNIMLLAVAWLTLVTVLVSTLTLMYAPLSHNVSTGLGAAAVALGAGPYLYTPPNAHHTCFPVSVAAVAARARLGGLLSEALGLGADVNAQDPCGASVLHYAALAQDYDEIVMLLQAGADPSLTDESGRTPADVAQAVSPPIAKVFVHYADRAKDPAAADAADDKAYFVHATGPGAKDISQEAAVARTRAAELGIGELFAVDRYPAGALSVDEFRRLYAEPRIPVILEGMDKVMFPDALLTRELLNATCGAQRVAVSSYGKSGTSWAGLADHDASEKVNLGHVLRGAVDPDAQMVGDVNLTGAHVFDWSFINNCPKTVNLTGFTIPDLFASDLFQELDPIQARCSRCLYWPSLFVQQNGTHSGLHQDARHTHFWQLLVDGNKEWVLFPPTQLPNLNHDIVASGAFNVDMFDIDPDAFPLASVARGWHAITQPGDLLFVPAHTPHQVANIRNPIALSSNYVDSTNYADYAASVATGADTHLQAAVAALPTSAPDAFQPVSHHKRFLTEYRKSPLLIGEYSELVNADIIRELSLTSALYQGITQLYNSAMGNI